jgi:uncharacterized membrane protein YtjA (UPF0391 family)
MSNWTVNFIIIAIVTIVFGYTNTAGLTVKIYNISFVFIVLAFVSFMLLCWKKLENL